MTITVNRTFAGNDIEQGGKYLQCAFDSMSNYDSCGKICMNIALSFFTSAVVGGGLALAFSYGEYEVKWLSATSLILGAASIVALFFSGLGYGNFAAHYNQIARAYKLDPDKKHPWKIDYFYNGQYVHAMDVTKQELFFRLKRNKEYATAFEYASYLFAAAATGALFLSLIAYNAEGPHFPFLRSLTTLTATATGVCAIARQACGKVADETQQRLEASIRAGRD